MITRRIAKLEAQKRSVAHAEALEQAAERARQWVEWILASYPPPAWCSPEKRSQAELIAASTLTHAGLREYFERMAEESGARGSLASRILETAARIESARKTGTVTTYAETR